MGRHDSAWISMVAALIMSMSVKKSSYNHKTGLYLQNVAYHQDVSALFRADSWERPTRSTAAAIQVALDCIIIEERKFRNTSVVLPSEVWEVERWVWTAGPNVRQKRTKVGRCNAILTERYLCAMSFNLLIPMWEDILTLRARDLIAWIASVVEAQVNNRGHEFLVPNATTMA